MKIPKRIEERLPKTLSNEETEFFIKMKPDDFTKNFVKTNFTRKMKKVTKKDGTSIELIDPKYMPYDELTIPKGAYNGNKQPIKTTIGTYLANKFLLQHFKVIDYIDKEFTNDVVEDISSDISALLLDKKISPIQVIEYINKFGWLYTITDLLCSSMTPSTSKPIPEILEKKDREIKKMKDVNDVIAYAKLEKELLKDSKKKLDGNIGMTLYNSGSQASFDNNYKSMYISKGPVQEISSGEFKTITSNFTDGIAKDELKYHFDAAVIGAYAKGKNTAVSGYETKKILAAYQTVILGEPGSDCGTKETLEITVDKFNIKLLKYSYMRKSNGDEVLLTYEMLKNMIGQTINIRFPMFCLNEHICNKCAGDLYYKMGYKNAGLTLARISTTIQGKSMKKFHDTSVKFYEVNVDDIVID